MEITPEQKKNLVIEATKVLDNRYPKDTPFAYGAAVLTENGTVYASSQYGSKTASLTLHAEQCALAHAASHGEGSIVAIAVASTEELEQGEFTAPCHMCKQLLWESHLNSKLPLCIILSNQHGETKEVDLLEMISYPWPAKIKI
jgi:cytidine deaminase